MLIHTVKGQNQSCRKDEWIPKPGLCSYPGIKEDHSFRSRTLFFWIIGIIFGQQTMMSLRPFLIERVFARYEFSEPYMLSASHCEPVKQQDLLAMADEETRHLWESLSLTYTESAGHPVLRTEIANLCQ